MTFDENEEFWIMTELGKRYKIIFAEFWHPSIFQKPITLASIPYFILVFVFNWFWSSQFLEAPLNGCMYHIFDVLDGSFVIFLFFLG